MLALLWMGSHREQVGQQAHMWLLLRSSLDKRPHVQSGGMHGEAGITLRSHSGGLPKLQRKSRCVQQQMWEEDISRQGGMAE